MEFQANVTASFAVGETGVPGLLLYREMNELLKYHLHMNKLQKIRKVQVFNNPQPAAAKATDK